MAAFKKKVKLVFVSSGSRELNFGLLTPEQLRTMNEALQSDTQLTGSEPNLIAAQKDAVKAVLDKNATEDSVKAKVQAVADLETQIAMERYNKGVKSAASLVTDAQKSQLDDMTNGFTYTATYNQMFGGGSGGFGGGFGGDSSGGHRWTQSGWHKRPLLRLTADGSRVPVAGGAACINSRRFCLRIRR